MAQNNASHYAHNIVMIEIPAGSFIMGACAVGSPDQGNSSCPSPDPHASINEGPSRTVQVNTFQMSKTEVTLGQFKAFIRANARTDLITHDFMRANSQGDNAPVVHVSWHDAQAFINWLNRTEGGGWRLPSEAEWEYACRSGDKKLYCTSSGQLTDGAWISENSGGHQHSVGSKRGNAWGLVDMSGNVYEWVQDCWHDNYRGAPSLASVSWTGGCHSDGRVLRGGSWGYDDKSARATARNENSPESRSLNFGFRLARTP